MKRLGLLGGMSWESSIEYERIINQRVRSRLGGTHSADMIIRSFDFAKIEQLQESGDWDGAGHVLVGAALDLQRAGADAVVLCTNTMHLLAPLLEDALGVPFIHIADPTADAIEADGIDHVALLGTRYTMENDFISGRLEARGIATMVPSETERLMIHNVIFEELVRGVIDDRSRTRIVNAISRLTERGAEGVVAGCTEIELLVSPHDLDVPLYPTAELHALAAADWALESVDPNG